MFQQSSEQIPNSRVFPFLHQVTVFVSVPHFHQVTMAPERHRPNQKNYTTPLSYFLLLSYLVTGGGGLACEEFGVVCERRSQFT